MILVCGEALIDLLVSEAANARLTVEARPGGAPFNVAIGLARLGELSAFFGGLSRDPLGRALADALARETVDLSCAVRTDAPSMVAVAGTDRDGVADYSFPVRDGADKHLPALDATAAWDGNLRALILGSYLTVLEPGAGHLLALARRHAAGSVVCLDPNVRPALVPGAAPWRDGVERFLPFTDIAKASEDDLRALYGDEACLDAIARDWLGRGPNLVLLTRGAAGATAFLPDGGVLTAGGFAVAAIDSVGAGDAFLAAAVAFLARAGCLTKPGIRALDAATLDPALRFAVAASALTCTRRGAVLPTWDEVSAFERARR